MSAIKQTGHKTFLFKRILYNDLVLLNNLWKCKLNENNLLTLHFRRIIFAIEYEIKIEWGIHY